MEIGKYHTLEVGKEVDFGVYLNSEVGEILLPIKYIPEGLEVGNDIEVFIYRDSEDRIIATTLRPYAELNEFAALEVKDVTDHGAFMEWGLEKDLFVPNREQNSRFIQGNKYVVRVCLDHQTDRLIGTAKLGPFFSAEVEQLEEGQEVDLLIYRKTEVGFMAVINKQFNGLIYNNEIFEPIFIGDEKKGFVKKIREDGKIDLTLNKTGTEAIDDNSQTVLSKLQENDGYLPYHDKSDPEDIKQAFNLSKKAFKKAIGSLYKSKKIIIESEGIRLSK